MDTTRKIRATNDNDQQWGQNNPVGIWGLTDWFLWVIWFKCFWQMSETESKLCPLYKAITVQRLFILKFWLLYKFIKGSYINLVHKRGYIHTAKVCINYLLLPLFRTLFTLTKLWVCDQLVDHRRKTTLKQKQTKSLSLNSIWIYKLLTF